MIDKKVTEKNNEKLFIHLSSFFIYETNYRSSDNNPISGKFDFIYDIVVSHFFISFKFLYFLPNIR